MSILFCCPPKDQVKGQTKEPAIFFTVRAFIRKCALDRQTLEEELVEIKNQQIPKLG